MAGEKAKYWWAVCYLENMKPTWQDDIGDLLQVPYVYCIHDKDLDLDGDCRKPHVHIYLAFPNTTTYKHAMSVFEELNADGKRCLNTCKRIINARNAYNYLIHDTDECRKKRKHLYDKSERICGNCFDIGAYEQLGQEEKEAIRRELSWKVIQEMISDYSALYIYVVSNYDNEYERVLVSYQGHFDKLCKGVYRKLEKYKKLDEAEKKRNNPPEGSE